MKATCHPDREARTRGLCDACYVQAARQGFAELRVRRPRPIKETTWMDEAICDGMDQSIFFPKLGDDTRRAKAICAACPVRTECVEFGLDERHGVYGGLSPEERREIRKRRRKAA